MTKYIFIIIIISFSISQEMPGEPNISWMQTEYDLNDEGVIFVHDCLPKSFFHQTALRSRNVWNGDVWKSIVEFRTKNSLDTCTCFIDHGLGIILKRPNNNILKIKFKNFKKLKFKYFYYNHNELMNIIPYDKVNIFLEF